MTKTRLYVLLIGLLVLPLQAHSYLYKTAIDSILNTYETCYPHYGRYNVDKLYLSDTDSTLNITVTQNFGKFMFTPNFIDTLYAKIYAVTQEGYPNYKPRVYVQVDRHQRISIEYYVPNLWRTNQPNVQDKTPTPTCQEDSLNQDSLRPAAKRPLTLRPERLPRDERRDPSTARSPQPFVTNESQPYTLTQGLQNRNLALWQSHGWFYNQNRDMWDWQRPRLYTTCEDKFTQSFVLKYLVPMLENAGAYVFLPRERDTQIHEYVADNDGCSPGAHYQEVLHHATALHPKGGFKYTELITGDFYNPFHEGTFTLAKTNMDVNDRIEWRYEIEQAGQYAVYISYEPSDEPIDDALYVVHHAGGETQFKVDQRKGAGTWIYLGTFFFKPYTSSPHITTSNPSPTDSIATLQTDTVPLEERTAHSYVALLTSSSHQGVVSADAVRLGGGMGNIARRPATSLEVQLSKLQGYSKASHLAPYDKDQYVRSGRPRYLEGARYWMQYAGVPYKRWSWTFGTNDKVDDFAKRADWVNWLNNASENAPDSVGLGLPIDAVLALHSDAGIAKDSIVGSLGICTVKREEKDQPDVWIYPNEQLRWASRDLVSVVLSQVSHDMKKIYPHWHDRGVRDADYAETRVADVPTMILESLSHQNFDDMTFGLDPRFQFAFSRAIYKGLLRYLADAYDRPYVMEPLPVHDFRLRMKGDSLALSWEPTLDTLEPTAQATGYIIYRRRADGGFDNGRVVTQNHAVLALPQDAIYSYKVCALNAGGKSFPSEILAAYYSPENKKSALIINGFTRLSAPEFYQDSLSCGFPDYLDHGVSYLSDISYVGPQVDFLRSSPYVNNVQGGCGRSLSKDETLEIKGNTFDYPYVHGESFQALHFNFVSSSLGAVLAQSQVLEGFDLVDVILGEQLTVPYGLSKRAPEFTTFPRAFQKKLTAYTLHKGMLLVSGAHVASDLQRRHPWDKSSEYFLRHTLHIHLLANDASKLGEVHTAYCPIGEEVDDFTFHFSQTRNDSIYEVESPDALRPSYGGQTLMRYTENNFGAGIVYQKKDQSSLVLGFPLESVLSLQDRTHLIKLFLDAVQN